MEQVIGQPGCLIYIILHGSNDESYLEPGIYYQSGVATSGGGSIIGNERLPRSPMAITEVRAHFYSHPGLSIHAGKWKS